jgi:hypothetical protein
MVHRLWAALEKAEKLGTDDARLDAYEQLRQMISWLLFRSSGTKRAIEAPTL